jgi:hypothetical protein
MDATIQKGCPLSEMETHLSSEGENEAGPEVTTKATAGTPHYGQPTVQQRLD